MYAPVLTVEMTVVMVGGEKEYRNTRVREF